MQKQVGLCVFIRVEVEYECFELGIEYKAFWIEHACTHRVPPDRGEPSQKVITARLNQNENRSLSI